jgi:hypothetical protein
MQRVFNCLVAAHPSIQKVNLYQPDKEALEQIQFLLFLCQNQKPEKRNFSRRHLPVFFNDTDLKNRLTQVMSSVIKINRMLVRS